MSATAFEMARRAAPTLKRWLVCSLLLACLGVAAQPAKAPTDIYTCTDSKGKRLSADRPIAECANKEQQVLNRDGSVRAVLPPTLTAEERADKEARDRAAAEARSAHADAVRRDRNLMARFPDEASHNRAREAAADTVRLAMKASEIRLRELGTERKPLRDEAEFYKGKILPLKLKTAMDANDASMEGQRSSSANQEAELVRINKIYDAELDRLRRLWSGAQAGSLGPMALPPPPVKPPIQPAPSSQSSQSASQPARSKK